MLPLKDNLPHERVPLVVLALAILNVLAYALPAKPLPLAPTLLDLAALALLGPSVEAALGHPRFAALCLAGAAAGVGLGAALSEGTSATTAFAATGATVATLAAYVTRFPRARVIGLVLVPFAVTIVEVPAAILLGAWTAAQLYLGLAR
ncbi:MAG TPA: rhomboid family intramembrane serine protease [Solirubrobacteraceae bacterium]|nr:rhomboid family intramembrane serine protease [Solirubrobacteraceae bacterium]